MPAYFIWFNHKDFIRRRSITFYWLWKLKLQWRVSDHRLSKVSSALTSTATPLGIAVLPCRGQLDNKKMSRKIGTPMITRLFCLYLPMISVFTMFCCFGYSRAAVSLNGLEDEQKTLLVWSKLEVIRKGRLILRLDKPGRIFSGRILGILGPSGWATYIYCNKVQLQCWLFMLALTMCVV